MDYLQQVVFNALKKNPDLDESYAKGFALSVERPIDLFRLDYGNIDRVAVELGCTSSELDNFMMITKAIHNAGKCEHTIAENRAYAQAAYSVLSDAMKEKRGD